MFTDPNLGLVLFARMWTQNVFDHYGFNIKVIKTVSLGEATYWIKEIEQKKHDFINIEIEDAIDLVLENETDVQKRFTLRIISECFYRIAPLFYIKKKDFKEIAASIPMSLELESYKSSTGFQCCNN